MRSIQRHYERHFLCYELVAALFIGVAFILFVEKGMGQQEFLQALKGTRQSIYVVVATVAGSLLGFIVTTVSIIMAFIHLPSLELVRKSKYYPTLYSIFFSAILYLALVTIWAVVVLIIDTDTSPSIWPFYVLVFLVIISIVRLVRCVWALEKTIITGIQEKPEVDN